MLKIRLQRTGRVHESTFRLVLTESKNSTKSGRVKEILGSYDPRKSLDSFNAERIRYWLSQGVGPTPTVNNLLVKHRIIMGKKIDVSSTSKKGSAADIPAETPTNKGTAPEETPAQETASESDTIEKVSEKEAV